MRKAIALTALSAALLAVFACKNDRAPSITSTTGAGIVTTIDAVDHLTARRCDHEIDCNNVGLGKRYDDRGGCEREIAHDLQEELGPTTCGNGIREERFDECMAAIRKESCGNPLDGLSKIASCRPSRLCIN